MKILYSIVIPTFNRIHLLPRAISSARRFLLQGGDAEIVLVDDASADSTETWVASNCADLINSGLLQYFRRDANGGATTAKNDGALLSRGEWLIFLDSDDELLPDAYDSISRGTKRFGEVPVIFFRCVDARHQLIGPQCPAQILSYAIFLQVGTPGECLPVVRRVAFLESPYDADLRGFEALCYWRLAKRFRCVAVSDEPARVYYTDDRARLCTRRALHRRACLMAKGFYRWLKEFGKDATHKRRLSMLTRFVYYANVCAFRRAVKPLEVSR